MSQPDIGAMRALKGKFIGKMNAGVVAGIGAGQSHDTLVHYPAIDFSVFLSRVYPAQN